MARRKKKPTEETPVTGGDSCTALVPRLEKLEKAFKELTGVSIEQYEESEADNPVIEEKRYDRSVIKIHKSGAIEYLRICEWCGAEVADLATHKAKCVRRPIY